MAVENRIHWKRNPLHGSEPFQPYQNNSYTTDRIASNGLLHMALIGNLEIILSLSVMILFMSRPDHNPTNPPYV